MQGPWGHLGLLLLLGWLLAAPALGAPRPPRQWRALADTASAPPLPADATAQAPIRRPAAERLRELRGQRELQYVEGTGAPEGAGFLARLMAWLWRWLAPVFNTKGGRVAWDIIFYGLMGATLLFAVLKLLQVDLTKVFGRAPRALPLAYETGQENIHELNFADALAQAEAAGNLRLAVRLGYLQLLKQLTDRDFIAWQPDKTNQAYLRELAASQPTARPAFAELTRQFEYAWYGELPVSAALYQQVRESQRQFGQQLSGAGRAAHLA
ncbi:DUF4129 domain-containing protein [Siccationidurans sp. BT559]|uniref:DUF4129 domain-containing protein n=1 Tax=Hymenobacter sp. BT559 TaxID=2795729 RepID=UPI0018EB8973